MSTCWWEYSIIVYDYLQIFWEQMVVDKKKLPRFDKDNGTCTNLNNNIIWSNLGVSASALLMV